MTFHLSKEEKIAAIKQLKAGDRVATYSYSAWNRLRYSIATVSKVTPSGRVRLEDGKEFNPDGSQRGVSQSKYSSLCELRILTEEIEAEVALYKAVREVEVLIQKTNLEKLPLDSLQQLITLLKPQED